MSSQRIAAFGMGAMGGALATALVKAGTNLTIWNRTADKPYVKSLTNAGAVYESNIQTAISKSDGILFFCLVDYNATYMALDSIKDSSDALAGKIVVNVANGTPKQAVEMSEWIKARGASHYFDGSVLVPPEMVATPQSLLIYSGESEDSFGRLVRDIVSPLGNTVYSGSEVDASSAQDLAMLAAMYGLFQGAMVGMGILKRAGKGAGHKVLPSTESITVPIMSALTPLLNKIAQKIDDDDFSDHGGNPLEMMLFGIDNITQAAKDVKVNAKGLEVLADAMRRAVGDGHGAGDFAATSKYLFE